MARREKPSPKRPNAPEDQATGATSLRENSPQLARGIRALECLSRAPSVPLSGSGFSGRATEVMVPEKTDKTASPMLNGGMAEAGF